MYPDSYPTRYRPSSPLSPRSSSSHGSLSSQSARGRISQSAQTSRGVYLDIPTHSGISSRGRIVSPPPVSQSQTMPLGRGIQSTPTEVTRLMREKQKELIAHAQLSSKLAASPMSIKPEAPRLDPLGSPKGPVTPFALEEHEPIDYFTAISAGRFSPTASPTARSSRSSTASGKEDKLKKHKVELYQ